MQHTQFFNQIELSKYKLLNIHSSGKKPERKGKAKKIDLQQVKFNQRKHSNTVQTDGLNTTMKIAPESLIQSAAPITGSIFGGSGTPLRPAPPALLLNQIYSNVYKARSAVRTRVMPDTYQAKDAKQPFNWATLSNQKFTNSAL